MLSTDPELEKLPSDLLGEGLCRVCSAGYKRLKSEDISSEMYQWGTTLYQPSKKTHELLCVRDNPGDAI